MTKYVDCYACIFRDGKHVLCKKHGRAALQKVADDALDRATRAIASLAAQVNAIQVDNASVLAAINAGE